MKVNMTQKEYNSFLKKASKEIEEEIASLLPSESSYHIFHVYEGSGKGKGYKRFHKISLKEIKGITFLILNHKGHNYVYTAHCHEQDTYSKAFGRKEVLSKLNKDVQSKFKSDHTDFKVPSLSNVSQKEQEDALINLKTNLANYTKVLRFKPKGRTSISTSQFIEALGGTPLLLKQGWVFIEEDGSIHTCTPLPHLQSFDTTTHYDKNWDKNLVSLVNEVMEKDLTLDSELI